MTRLILGEGTNELTRLFKPVKMEYNKMRLQGSNSQTCGRFCVLFITLTCKMMYDMNEFYAYMKKKKTESGLSYDELVCKLI